MNEFMKFLKYGCAILALIYLVYAFLPSHFIVDQHSRAGEVYPEWFNRTALFVYFLIYGAISYGLQKRRPIYWRLIPVLVGALSLDLTVETFFDPRFSTPRFMHLFLPIIVLVMFLIFIAWWRNQKSYFAATPGSD